jgi:glycosyltransferase involved in cell wall biosynthesis
MSQVGALSIITPVYNGVTMLEACMLNVINQQCPAVEHIIVDGGSTDGTVDMIKAYASRYSHIRWLSEKDRGQSDAMNKGIRMAEYPIISFLNVDDYYEPGVFNRVLLLFEGVPHPALVVGHCNIRRHDGSLIRVSQPHHLNLIDLLVLRGEFPQNPSSYFYHKSLHEVIGYYNEKEHFNLDVEFIYNAVQRARIILVDEVWGNFRMTEGSKTKGIVESGNYWKNYFAFRDQYVQKLPKALQYRYLARQKSMLVGEWVQKKYRSLQYYKRKLLGMA